MFFLMTARTESAKSEPLLEWLSTHQQDVISGCASYNGHRICLDTKLSRYTTVLSFFFFTYRLRSPYVLLDDQETVKQSWRSSLLTTLLGWWSLYGIVYAPAALLMNATGGQTKTVGKFYEDLKLGKFSEPFDMRELCGYLAIPTAFVALLLVSSFGHMLHA